MNGRPQRSKKPVNKQFPPSPVRSSSQSAQFLQEESTDDNVEKVVGQTSKEAGNEAISHRNQRRVALKKRNAVGNGDEEDIDVGAIQAPKKRGRPPKASVTTSGRVERQQTAQTTANREREPLQEVEEEAGNARMAPPRVVQQGREARQAQGGRDLQPQSQEARASRARNVVPKHQKDAGSGSFNAVKQEPFHYEETNSYVSPALQPRRRPNTTEQRDSGISSARTSATSAVLHIKQEPEEDEDIFCEGFRPNGTSEVILFPRPSQFVQPAPIQYAPAQYEQQELIPLPVQVKQEAADPEACWLVGRSNNVAKWSEKDVAEWVGLFLGEGDIVVKTQKIIEKEVITGEVLMDILSKNPSSDVRLKDLNLLKGHQASIAINLAKLKQPPLRK